MQQEIRELNLASLIKEYANYNLWANKQLVEWLKTKPSEKMEQEVASSFPSIEKTLIHMWGTERFWFSVFKQTPPPPPLGDRYDGKIKEVFNGILKQSEEIAQYVNSLTEVSIKEDCNLDILKFIIL